MKNIGVLRTFSGVSYSLAGLIMLYLAGNLIMIYLQDTTAGTGMYAGAAFAVALLINAYLGHTLLNYIIFKELEWQEILFVVISIIALIKGDTLFSLCLYMAVFILFLSAAIELLACAYRKISKKTVS